MVMDFRSPASAARSHGNLTLWCSLVLARQSFRPPYLMLHRAVVVSLYFTMFLGFARSWGVRMGVRAASRARRPAFNAWGK